MDTQQIIQALRNERQRIDQAITALTGGSASISRHSDRRGPRRMSAEARKRISEAQKRRWAKQMRQ